MGRTAQSTASASVIPTTFKGLVQKRAEERGILFMPLPRNQDGHALFKVGSIVVYIDQGVIFQKLKDSYVPISLDELFRWERVFGIVARFLQHGAQVSTSNPDCPLLSSKKCVYVIFRKWRNTLRKARFIATSVLHMDWKISSCSVWLQELSLHSASFHNTSNVKKLLLLSFHYYSPLLSLLAIIK